MTTHRLSNIEAVLFDLDGTLADTAPDLAAAANAMLQARDLPEVPFERLRPQASHGARGLLGAAFGIAPDDAGYESLRVEFLERYESAICVHSRLFEGMTELLTMLDAREIPWGIVTNKATRFTTPLTRLLGLATRAQCIVAGDTTPHTKPHPAPLIEAARRLGRRATGCVYIGDDERDITAGRAAGMATIAAAYGYCGDSDPHAWRADAVIDRPPGPASASRTSHRPGMNDWSIVGLSLEVACGATLLGFPFALAAAWILARHDFTGKALLDAVVNAPLVLPPVVVGYLLLVTLGAHAPIGALLLHLFHLQLIFTTAGAIVAAAVMALPLMVRGMRMSFDSVDGRLETAARTLGARPADVFVSITLPLILPGIVSGCLLGFARALGEFGATITFASNIAGETRTLPLAIYTAINSASGDAEVEHLVILSLVLAVLAITVASVFEKRVRLVLGQRRA